MQLTYWNVSTLNSSLETDKTVIPTGSSRSVNIFKDLPKILKYETHLKVTSNDILLRNPKEFGEEILTDVTEDS